MRPIKFTVKNGKTIFHYPFSFLREFVTLGQREGNTGMILVGRTGDMFTYKGFGTIENPRTTMFTFHMKHFELMDGPIKTDEDQLKEAEWPFKDMKIFIPHTP